MLVVRLGLVFGLVIRLSLGLVVGFRIGLVVKDLG